MWTVQIVENEQKMHIFSKFEKYSNRVRMNQLELKASNWCWLEMLLRAKKKTSVNSPVIYFSTGVWYIYTLVNGLCDDLVAVSTFNWCGLYEIYETPNHVLILLNELCNSLSVVSAGLAAVIAHTKQSSVFINWTTLPWRLIIKRLSKGK